LPKRVEDDLEFRIVPGVIPVEVLDLAGEFFIVADKGAHPNESANDGDVNFDGAITVENGGKHCYAVLSERERHCSSTASAGV